MFDSATFFISHIFFAISKFCLFSFVPLLHWTNITHYTGIHLGLLLNHTFRANWLLTGNITGKDTVCATKTDTLGITVQWTGYNAVWSVTNANAAISATGVATGLSPGRDTVVYTVSNGAGSTAQTTFPIYVASKGHCDSISGIQTIAAGTPRVLIYPNPATTIITVLDPNADKYEITDLSGRSLLSGKLATGASQIDIRSLAPGAYVVLLYRGQIMERRSKLIKQ